MNRSISICFAVGMATAFACSHQAKEKAQRNPPGPASQPPTTDGDANPGNPDGASSDDSADAAVPTTDGTDGNAGKEPGKTPKNEPSPYIKTVSPNAESVQKDLIGPYCVPCHQGPSPAGKLALSDVALFADGGLHGYVGARPITPGSPSASVLIQVLTTQTSRHRMPPVGNSLGIPDVMPSQLKAFQDWIAVMPPLPASDEGDVDISIDSDALDGAKAAMDDGGFGSDPE